MIHTDGSPSLPYIYSFPVMRRLTAFLLCTSVLVFSACDVVGGNSDDSDSSGGSDGPGYTRATVTRVVVQDMPFTSGGANWDVFSGPDVYYAAFDGNDNRIASSNIYTDASGTPLVFSNASFVMDNFAEEYSVNLYDYDSATSDDFIGGIVFTLNGVGATSDFPSTISLNTGGIRLEMEVTWN